MNFITYIYLVLLNIDLSEPQQLFGFIICSLFFNCGAIDNFYHICLVLKDIVLREPQKLFSFIIWSQCVKIEIDEYNISQLNSLKNSM